MTHGLDAIRGTDRVVLADGRAAGRGTREQLLAAGGHYTALACRDAPLAAVP